MLLPRARTTDILEQEAGDELLTYDLLINKAYNLNATSKIVYRACANGQSFDDLKSAHRFTDDLVHLTLSELQKNNLLENYENDYFAGMSRREVIRRVGLASMVALPIISSLIAPKATQAGSGACKTIQRSCTTDDFRQSNCCARLRCDGGICANCRGQGVQYQFDANATVNRCNFDARKNLCCNTTNSATVNFGACLCG